MMAFAMNSTPFDLSGAKRRPRRKKCMFIFLSWKIKKSIYESLKKISNMYHSSHSFFLPQKSKKFLKTPPKKAHIKNPPVSRSYPPLHPQTLFSPTSATSPFLFTPSTKFIRGMEKKEQKEGEEAEREFWLFGYGYVPTFLLSPFSEFSNRFGFFIFPPSSGFKKWGF